MRFLKRSTEFNLSAFAGFEQKVRYTSTLTLTSHEKSAGRLELQASQYIQLFDRRQLTQIND
jgi:hypothetical protein